MCIFPFFFRSLRLGDGEFRLNAVARTRSGRQKEQWNPKQKNLKIRFYHVEIVIVEPRTRPYSVDGQ